METHFLIKKKRFIGWSSGVRLQITNPMLPLRSVLIDSAFSNPNGAVINHNHTVKNNAAKKPSVDTLLIQTKMQPNWHQLYQQKEEMEQRMGVFLLKARIAFLRQVLKNLSLPNTVWKKFMSSDRTEPAFPLLRYLSWPAEISVT